MQLLKIKSLACKGLEVSQKIKFEFKTDSFEYYEPL